jgi:sulfhydrogenase subunit beta (sulfur reductase)
MKVYLLPLDNITTFIKALSEDGSVYYPILQDNKSHLVKFNKDEEFRPNFSKIRATENIKHFLFPCRDVVATFPKDANSTSSKQFLFGIKNCDLRGIDVYDRVFLNWEPIDLLYKQKREQTIIISADCPEPEDSCFCNLVGLNPFGESICDINFSQVSGGLLFEVYTKRGEDIVNKQQDLFTGVSKEVQKERDKVRDSAIKKLEQINSKKFRADMSDRIEKADKKTIHTARDECVECFGCLHACPTCYCFLLSDYKKGKNIERVRTWDACYYSAYARVGGGANPRSSMDTRFWNRFQCKFNYFHQYEKIFACSGCGRCFLGCSAKIDIREILWKL